LLARSGFGTRPKSLKDFVLFSFKENNSFALAAQASGFIVAG